MALLQDREEREEQELRLAAYSALTQALFWLLIGLWTGFSVLVSVRINPQVHVLLLAVFIEATVLRRVSGAYRTYRQKGEEADRVARRRAARLPRK